MKKSSYEIAQDAQNYGLLPVRFWLLALALSVLLNEAIWEPLVLTDALPGVVCVVGAFTGGIVLWFVVWHFVKQWATRRLVARASSEGWTR